jgi:hypothetical protein
MAKAWVFQDERQLKKYGSDAVSWYCGWYEPGGRRRKKSFGPGFIGKTRAEREKARLEEQITTGNYQPQIRKRWDEFRADYERKILAGLSARTRELAAVSLDHFERIMKPGRVSSLRTEHVDAFIERRRQEPGRRQGDLLSAASLNKDLRHIKAALSVAIQWGCLAKMPLIRMEREAGRLKPYVTPEQFTSMYVACSEARLPK